MAAFKKAAIFILACFGLPKSDNSLAHFGEAQNIREQGDFPLTPF